MAQEFLQILGQWSAFVVLTVEAVYSEPAIPGAGLGHCCVGSTESDGTFLLFSHSACE